MSNPNQVPDEDTQISMRAMGSHHRGKGLYGDEGGDEDGEGGDEGDGFTLADALTLNDGITLGDNQTTDEANILSDQDQQTLDTNTAGAASSFDRRTMTGSIGSPTFTQQNAAGDDDNDGGGDDEHDRRSAASARSIRSRSGEGNSVDVGCEGEEGERKQPRGAKFYASPSVESGLSVNSGTEPQNEIDFDDGGSGDGSTTSY
jgi:hypothetical protein